MTWPNKPRMLDSCGARMPLQMIIRLILMVTMWEAVGGCYLLASIHKRVQDLEALVCKDAGVFVTAKKYRSRVPVFYDPDLHDCRSFLAPFLMHSERRDRFLKNVLEEVNFQNLYEDFIAQYTDIIGEIGSVEVWKTLQQLKELDSSFHRDVAFYRLFYGHPDVLPCK